MTKTELRQRVLNQRKSLSASAVLNASRAIADAFFSLGELGLVGKLSTFIRIAKFNEIDTSTIYYALWKDRPWIHTFAPKTNIETCEIENVAFFPDTPLIENRWGVREPVAGDTIEAQELDLVIVPLLAVDAAGHRVGYGKGSYDRFLKTCRPDCLKVGVNYFPPCDAIPEVGEHDVALDICITPSEIFRFKGSPP